MHLKSRCMVQRCRANKMLTAMTQVVGICHSARRHFVVYRARADASVMLQN